MNDITTNEANPYFPPLSDFERPPAFAELPEEWPAERGTRLGAALLDGLVSIAAMIPGILLAFLIGNEDSWIGIVVAVVGLLALAIYQMVLISTRGQTLGKKWLGIKIVRLDGSDVGFGYGVAMRSWIPALIGAVPYVGGIFRLVDVLFIFTEERRCLHDHIAGTKVIVANP